MAAPVAFVGFGLLIFLVELGFLVVFGFLVILVILGFLVTLGVLDCCMVLGRFCILKYADGKLFGLLLMRYKRE